MLNKLCCSQGVADVWDDTLVYTLVSAPDSKLEDTGEDCFTYDTFLLLTIAPSYKNWKFQHYVQDAGMSQRTWQMRQIRGPKDRTRRQPEKALSA